MDHKTKIQEAQAILKAFGLPPAQQNEISALTLLALGGLRPEDNWDKARRHRVTITKGIMDFITEYYRSEKPYAPNTRETFRRQVLHQLIQARIVDYNPFEPDLPTNSPRAHYALSEEALATIQAYGTLEWEVLVTRFISQQGSLLSAYQKKRASRLISVQLPQGISLELSPGKHNLIQAAVLKEFVPRFASNATLLYLGDTAKKILYTKNEELTALEISVTEHDKLPDIILYDRERNWLFLIEVVTSHGPVTPKRVLELERMLEHCPAGKILVSAFPDFQEFRKHVKEIAWETEVWLAEMPDHLIHFNGDRFLGPH